MSACTLYMICRKCIFPTIIVLLDKRDTRTWTIACLLHSCSVARVYPTHLVDLLQKIAMQPVASMQMMCWYYVYSIFWYNVCSISHGEALMCALTADNVARCWGSFDYSKSPVLQTPVAGVANMVLARGLICTVSMDESKLSCFGRNGPAAIPTALQGAVMGVAGGMADGVCAIDKNTMELACFGQDDYNKHFSLPMQLGPVTSVSLGSGTICAITVNATVRCWGGSGVEQSCFPLQTGSGSFLLIDPVFCFAYEFSYQQLVLTEKFTVYACVWVVGIISR